MAPKVSTVASPVAKRTGAPTATSTRSRSATPTRQRGNTTPRQSGTPPKASIGTPPKAKGATPKANTTSPKTGGPLSKQHGPSQRPSTGQSGRVLGSTVSAPGLATAKKASMPQRATPKSTTSPAVQNLGTVFLSDSEDEGVVDSRVPTSNASVSTTRDHAEARQRLEVELEKLQLENAELRKSQKDVEMQRVEIAEIRAQSEEFQKETSALEALQACREDLANMQKENATLRARASELEHSQKEMMRLLKTTLQDLALEKERQTAEQDECLRNIEAQLQLSQDNWQCFVSQIRSEISSESLGVHPNSKECLGTIRSHLPKPELADETVTNGQSSIFYESLSQSSNRKSVSFHDALECLSPDHSEHSPVRLSQSELLR